MFYLVETVTRHLPFSCSHWFLVFYCNIFFLALGRTCKPSEVVGNSISGPSKGNLFIAIKNAHEYKIGGHQTTSEGDDRMG